MNVRGCSNAGYHQPSYDFLPRPLEAPSGRATRPVGLRCSFLMGSKDPSKVFEGNFSEHRRQRLLLTLRPLSLRALTAITADNNAIFIPVVSPHWCHKDAMKGYPSPDLLDSGTSRLDDPPPPPFAPIGFPASSAKKQMVRYSPSLLPFKRRKPINLPRPDLLSRVFSLEWAEPSRYPRSSPPRSPGGLGSQQG